MMGYEDQAGYEEAHLYPSKDQMTSLPLSDEPPSQSNGSNPLIDDPLSQSSMFVDIPTDDSDLPQSQSGPRNPNSIHSILEPPSYAEAVFRSFDLDSVDDDSSPIHDRSLLESSSFSSADYLRISVSDPQREMETTGSLVPGSGYYVSYLITTFTNLPDFDGSEFNVRRRFRDVVSLSDRLAENFRGYFIPLRPDKNVVESQVMQKNEFVEQRRMALEKYLKQLSKHPVIRRSEDLRTFLTSSGRLLLARTNAEAPSRMLEGGNVSDVSVVSQSVKGGGRDLFRIFKELKQSVVNDWGGAKPPIVEEDKEFLEKKDKLQDLEQQLSLVSMQAESLVKAQQDIGETMGQLGMAFVKLTKFETEEALYDSQRARAADMKNLATAAVKASRLYRELNSQTVKHLDKLHDYLGVMLAVNNAFSDRSSALLRVQALLTDLSSLNSRIEKLEAASSKIFGGDSSRIRKIEDLRETVRATEDVKDCAISEYERVKENNRNELERLDKERHDDFVNMLKGFVVNQAGYAEKMATIWGAVAEETSRYVRN